MKIAVIAPGGITNFGERAIMLGTIYTLREQHPDAAIGIFGYQDLVQEDPPLHAELTRLGVVFYPLIIQGSSKAAKACKAISIALAPKRALPADSYAFLRDAVVYTKGQETLTEDYGLVHFIDSILEPLLVSRFNKQVILFGHSIGPVAKYKTLATWAVKRFQKIYVRDSRSREVLASLGYPAEQTEQIKDLAYAAVTRYKLGKPTRKDHYLLVPNAAICTTPERAEEYMQNLRTIIEALHKKQGRVVIGSSVTATDWNGDYRLCRQLQAEYGYVELHEYSRLDEFLRDVKYARKVISSRLHPLIMATGLDVPVFAPSRSHKVKGLLGDLGLSGNIADPFERLAEGAVAKQV